MIYRAVSLLALCGGAASVPACSPTRPPAETDVEIAQGQDVQYDAVFPDTAGMDVPARIDAVDVPRGDVADGGARHVDGGDAGPGDVAPDVPRGDPCAA